MLSSATIATVHKALRSRLEESAEVDNPRLEARLLLSKVTGLSSAGLIAHDERVLSAEELASLEKLVQERLKGRPMAQLLGHREFWSLDLKVTEDTLIPRPDTELLVSEALSVPFKSVLDLGTGTGAIILALKKERPEAIACAVDRSAAALAVAEDNARLAGLEVCFREGSWFEPLEREGTEARELFDLIVSNPPYIREGDPHLEQNGLNFEPQSALVAVADGLDDLRVIVAAAPHYLSSGGHLMVEHGYDQGQAVRALFEAAGFKEVRTLRDLGGNERVTRGHL